MKKGVLFVGVVLCLLFLNIFLIQANTDELGEEIDKNIKDLEGTKENIETKWDYLGEEWKNILLKNKIVNTFDSFLKKISFVFEVLVAEPYTFSVTLLVIVLLWFYLFLKIKEIIGDYSGLSSGISSLIGFGGAVTLAHIGFIRSIVEFLGWIVFSQEAGWARWIIIIVIAFVLIFIYKVSSMFGDAYQKSIEELEKEQEKINRKTLRAYVNIIVKAFKSK